MYKRQGVYAVKWKKPVAIIALIVASPYIMKAIRCLFGVLGAFVVWLAFNASPSPPVPEIKHGEFPFHLVYEIKGEQKEIVDTLICDYDGVAVTANGKIRRWKMSMASGSDTKEVFLATVYDLSLIHI